MENFFAHNLKVLRKAFGYTGQDIAEKVGVKRSSIGSYESGKAMPQFDNLSTICDLFGITLDLLITTQLEKSVAEKAIIKALEVKERDDPEFKQVFAKSLVEFLNVNGGVVVSLIEGNGNRNITGSGSHNTIGKENDEIMELKLKAERLEAENKLLREMLDKMMNK